MADKNVQNLALICMAVFKKTRFTYDGRPLHDISSADTRKAKIIQK